jgi:alpha-amylase/alpha-mannosidase (GH57 family)
MSQIDVRVVVHGHFYQPPRENPWTDDVPEQSSANPHHDWNERILVECYRPNTASRVLDPSGRIRDIVNNFEHLSFNVGPTLLAWLQPRHPDVYERIIAADRRSRGARSGHGNALAQAYNHMILPLANERDRETQIRWGLRDFELRFGRPAEGMWLAETAIHAGTVDALVECGVCFTVLSPFQARRVRPLAGGSWHDVSGGRIDARQPYRVRTQDGRGSLNVFFYDAPVSQAVAFEKILSHADDLGNRIAAIVDRQRRGPQLATLAVDGETFGHHEAFGDMCLAAFFTGAAAARDFKTTNFGEALDFLEPQFEVELQPGEHGDGTAWSCAHGVGRWVRDCGCSTGAPDGWNQAWRGPLRNALDQLRDRVATLFEKHGQRVLQDPWAARDQYIDVLTRFGDADANDAFRENHLRRDGGTNARQCALALLEAQRHAMAMYTSCAWFFSDVAGIETIQNMRYAARCMQLMRPFSTENLEARLLEDLAAARSNNGRDTAATLYRRWVAPEVRVPEHAVTTRALFRGFNLDTRRQHFYGFELEERDDTAVVVSGVGGRLSHLDVRDRRTTARGTYTCLSLLLAPRVLTCFVTTADRARHKQIARELRRLRSDMSRSHLQRVLTSLFGAPARGAGELLHPERREIAERLAAERVSAMRVHYRAMFDESVELLRDFSEMRLDVPDELRVPCTLSLQSDLEEAVVNLHPPYRPEHTERLISIVRLGEALHLHIDRRVGHRSRAKPAAIGGGARSVAGPQRSAGTHDRAPRSHLERRCVGKCHVRASGARARRASALRCRRLAVALRCRPRPRRLTERRPQSLAYQGFQGL